MCGGGDAVQFQYGPFTNHLSKVEYGVRVYTGFYGNHQTLGGKAHLYYLRCRHQKGFHANEPPQHHGVVRGSLCGGGELTGQLSEVASETSTLPVSSLVMLGKGLLLPVEETEGLIDK